MLDQEDDYFRPSTHTKIIFFVTAKVPGVTREDMTIDQKFSIDIIIKS